MNFLAVLGQDVLELAAADDLAHRALRHRLDGRVGRIGRIGRAFDVEEIGAGILHHPIDGEVDVDDVLVAGQHFGFGGNVRARAVAVLVRDAIADIDLALMRHVQRVGGLDGPGQVIVDARRRARDIAAEAQHDALLIGADEIDARGEPYDDDAEQ